LNLGETYTRELDAAVTALGGSTPLLDVKVPVLATGGPDNADLVGDRVVPEHAMLASSPCSFLPQSWLQHFILECAFAVKLRGRIGGVGRVYSRSSGLAWVALVGRKTYGWRLLCNRKVSTAISP
jgi:hypothetical protein